MDENVDDTEGKTAEEVEEMLKEKEAKANAQILELVRIIHVISHVPFTEVVPTIILFRGYEVCFC